mmetsp:Transcript_12852/g.30318  ORF Transcript_12852/g.30318 Transcript_12852/m.30318 type:complete len:252 (+) Transcript_12852:82-837(+)
MRDGGGVDELAPLYLVLCHLETRTRVAAIVRAAASGSAVRRATAARAQRAPRGAIPRGGWVGLGRLASGAERLDGGAPLLGRHKVSALAEALEDAGELGRGLRVVDGEVGRRVEQPLAAERELLRRHDGLVAEALHELLSEGDVPRAAVEREHEEPLDDLVAEGRRVQLAHAAHGLGHLAAHKVLARDLGDGLLERGQVGVGRGAPDLLPVAAEVCSVELRPRLRERVAVLRAAERLGRQSAREGGWQQVV